MTNEQKMQAVKNFLHENHIPFRINHVSEICGILLPLAIKKYRVAVRIGDNQTFYKLTKGKYYPVFIRDEDTEEKVLEKVQDSIIKSMTRYHYYLDKKRKNGKSRNGGH